jgi:hypothetical protein
VSLPGLTNLYPENFSNPKIIHFWYILSTTFFNLGSRYGSAVKWWNEKINEIKRSRVRSPARATIFLNTLFVAWI